MAHQTTYESIEEFEAAVTDYAPLLDYRALLSNWVECFGQSQVFPLIYDRHQDVSVRFGDAIGLRVLPNAQGASNPNAALDAHAHRAMGELKRHAADQDLPLLVQRAHRELAHHFVDNYRHVAR